MPVTGFDQGAMPVTPGGEAAFQQGGAGEQNLLANMTGMQYGDVNPWLWQMILQQYMRDLQGQGDVAGQPFQDLNAHLATLVQQGGGPTNPQDPSQANDTINQILSASKTGLGGAKQLSDLLRSKAETTAANEQQPGQPTDQTQQQPSTTTPGQGKTTQPAPGSTDIASQNYIDPVLGFNPAYTPGVSNAPLPPLPPGMTSPLAGTVGPSPGVFGQGPAMQDVWGGVDAGGATGIENLPSATGNLGATSGGLGGAFNAGVGGLGGLMSLYSLAQAIKSGDPLAIGQSGAGTAMAAPGLINAGQYIMNLLSGAGSGAAAAGAAGATGLGEIAGPAISSGVEAGTEAGAAAGEVAGTAGAGAGSGAMSGALAAAGPWLSVAAPVIIGVLGNMQANEAKRAERSLGRKLRRTLGPQEEEAAQGEAGLANYDIANAGRQDPSQYGAFIESAAPGFRGMNPLDSPDTGGVNFPGSPLQNIGNLEAANDPSGRSMAAAKSLFAPYPGVYERMAYSLMQNPNAPTFDPFTTGTRDWYSTLPGTPDPRSFMSQDASGAPTATGGYSLDQLSTPDFAKSFWQGQGVSPQEAFLYGTGQELSNTGLMQPGLPGATGGDFSSYDPSKLYQYLVAQGMPDLAAGGGAGGGTGSPSGLNVGLTPAEQGGAGGGFVRSGGQSDPEKGQPGIASANLQAALGTAPNPWAAKAPGATLAAPGSPLEAAIAEAQKYLQG